MCDNVYYVWSHSPLKTKDFNRKSEIHFHGTSNCKEPYADDGRNLKTLATRISLQWRSNSAIRLYE